MNGIWIILMKNGKGTILINFFSIKMSTLEETYIITILHFFQKKMKLSFNLEKSSFGMSQIMFCIVVIFKINPNIDMFFFKVLILKYIII